MSGAKKYRLDRTAFKQQSLEEADKAMRDYSGYTIRERFQIAFYLTSIAYKFDVNNPPRMDKTYFRIRKRD